MPGRMAQNGSVTGKMPDIGQLDHVALHVTDVTSSTAFYTSVLGLEEIPRPAFSFPGAWFRLGSAQELHLIAGREHPASDDSRGNHFALQVFDIEAWAERLRSLDLSFKGPGQRPDGYYQIYLDDPDGHVIELCAAP